MALGSVEGNALLWLSAIVIASVAATAPSVGVGVAALVLVAVATGCLCRVVGVDLGAAMALLTVCLLERFELRVRGLAIRPEDVVVLTSFGIWLWNRQGRTRVRGLRPSLPEVVLVSWFGLNVLATVVNAPSVALSVRALAVVAMASLGFFLASRLRLNSTQWRTFWEFALVLLLAAAGYGLVGHVAGLAGAPVIASSVNPTTGLLSAYGSAWEPNTFGLVCVLGAIAWALLGDRFGRPAQVIALSIIGTAAVASFARAAWLLLAGGFAVLAGGVAIRTSGRERKARAATLAAAVIVTVALGAGLLRLQSSPHNPHVRDAAAAADSASAVGAGYVPATAAPQSNPPAHHIGVGDRLTNAVDLVGRAAQFSQALPDIRRHLLLGNGTASFGAFHQYQGLRLWIANLELRVLFDTGMLGVVLFAAFIALLGVQAWKARRMTLDYLALAAMAAAVVLFQTSTEMLELMLSWLVLGLLVARGHPVEGPA